MKNSEIQAKIKANGQESALGVNAPFYQIDPIDDVNVELSKDDFEMRTSGEGANKRAWYVTKNTVPQAGGKVTVYGDLAEKMKLVQATATRTYNELKQGFTGYKFIAA